ncbi:hypothetical protein CPB97_003162 [Podila verticillata]|nr:hypothetical protein CPB97_003162 [Podila verticillata]
MVIWKRSITAVISPLIALMKDQMKKLHSKDIPCFLLSTQDDNRIDDSDIEEIAKGRYHAMFMSPEIIFGQGSTAERVRRLWVDKRWRELLISIVVDEIHCVKNWVHFRKYYPCIGMLRGKVPGVPIVGLTATLPSESFKEIKNQVFLSSSIVKDKTMLDFVDNKIDVLLATDACGMGCDISDVITVIQYK